jgi:hypothetical protein
MKNLPIAQEAIFKVKIDRLLRLNSVTNTITNSRKNIIFIKNILKNFTSI